ncbi:zeta toxin family protein [Kribbella sp. HUAS MG21]|uniref:UDP-N-acetylglucosamine kinase n=1 Tax=Kribbella sp. HUAS MG21 TaxID=3160966 RepID=A0AAU7T4K2_9ACTN
MIGSTRLDLTLHEAQSVLARRLAQITPAEPPVRSPGQRPLVVLIGGPPGSGKSTTQWLLQASLGPSVAVYDFDDDITAHPRYDAIMRSRGMRAGDEIAQHLPRGMMVRCLERLRRGEPRYDVIASAPLHRVPLATNWADGFRAVDYRVALVYVTTHEANCRLGRASRYQQAVDDTGIGRWVRPELGDLGYRLVPDTAQEIESLAAVDDLYVVDRDGYVLYENHRGGDGRMPEPWLVKHAILAERNRPPTPAEHEQFLATAVPLLDRGDELAAPVIHEVRTAMAQHEARGPAQPRGREVGDRLGARVEDLRRITTAGLAAPSAIGSRGPGSSGGSRGVGSARSGPGHALDR